MGVVGAAVELEEEWPPTHTPAPAPARGRFDVFDRRLCTLVVALRAFTAEAVRYREIEDTRRRLDEPATDEATREEEASDDVWGPNALA